MQGAFPLVVDASNEQDAELRATVMTMSREVGPEVFCVQQEAVIGRADSRALLGSIVCSTLVVHGAGDRLIAPENGAELAEKGATSGASSTSRRAGRRAGGAHSCDQVCQPDLVLANVSTAADDEALAG